MIGRTNAGGGGGGGLNFKVITNPLPSTAKENTIWVDTDKINSYYFSATQPENMTNYDVWFPVGTSSNVAFNALKKNGILVYPLSAKQYVNGSLVNVDAKSYQNGEWVDWVIYLVNGAFLNTTFAGEWTKGTGSQGSGGSATMTEDGLKVTGNGVSGGSGGALRYGPEELIDFTEISEIIVEWEWVSGAKSIGMLLVTDVQNTAWNSANIARYDHTFTGGLETTVFDVSGVTGEHYFRVGTSTTTSSNIVFLIRSIELKRG